MSSDRYAARIAGFMFPFLIATVDAVSVLFGGLEEDEISETLRNVADNESRVQVSVVLLIVAGISTLILAAARYAITKHEDRNLAILAALLSRGGSRARRRRTQGGRPMLKALGATQAEDRVYRLLITTVSACEEEIAEGTGLSQDEVRTALASLVERGLVDRMPEPRRASWPLLPAWSGR